MHKNTFIISLIISLKLIIFGCAGPMGWQGRGSYTEYRKLDQSIECWHVCTDLEIVLATKDTLDKSRSGKWWYRVLNGPEYEYYKYANISRSNNQSTWTDSGLPFKPIDVQQYWNRYSNMKLTQSQNITFPKGGFLETSLPGWEWEKDKSYAPGERLLLFVDSVRNSLKADYGIAVCECDTSKEWVKWPVSNRGLIVISRSGVEIFRLAPIAESSLKPEAYSAPMDYSKIYWGDSIETGKRVNHLKSFGGLKEHFIRYRLADIKWVDWRGEMYQLPQQMIDRAWSISKALESLYKD